ncbi:hypothetical protein AU193_22285 [Mycobacterium sp. GA-1285]|uniref:TIR domain-containing protein n=1 Tax=Mycobacterium sp. GA-1285 TaxID=1772282 RepID=UPI00074A4476|nr:TIR domain-containing protein [Mycobacterium sp. GA-1285]KUI16916.1 hypothetical protein AU193_22285 [Mycobacterium sp. GA-1285]
MAGDKFKVFISWSGELAKGVARIWQELIKETFDAVEPFMSEENIGAGERNLAKIAEELDGTSFGIIVVTQQNQTSQWLNYEAGALSKNLGNAAVRVAPCLVDFERKSEVTGPLAQFQASLLNRDGVEYILTEVAKVVGVDVDSVKRRFGRSWNEYEQRFNEARVAVKAETPTPPRNRDDVLDEILTLVRDIARDQGAAASQSDTQNLVNWLWMQREAPRAGDRAFDVFFAPRSAERLGQHPRWERPLDLAPGDEVSHSSFGDGRVIEVDGQGHDAVAVIKFGSHIQEPVRVRADDNRLTKIEG